jgi:hypothetical protein
MLFWLISRAEVATPPALAALAGAKAMPFSWKGTLAQYVGRLHRNYQGKQDVRVYDYVDIHVPVLERMYQKRLKGYTDLGYQTLAGDTDTVPGMIYTGETWSKAFIRDLQESVREIAISAPSLARTQVRAVLSHIPSNVSLCVLTRAPEEYALEQQARVISAIRTLEDAGAVVKTLSGTIQRFAVIDQTLVWYGGINYLSHSRPDETAIRLESPELAGELMELGTEQG